MKTVTVTAAQPELRKLVEEAFEGGEVVLVYGKKKVMLHRYIPAGGALDMDLEADGAELEAELIKAVQAGFTPYDSKDLLDIAERARREKAA